MKKVFGERVAKHVLSNITVSGQFYVVPPLRRKRKMGTAWSIGFMSWTHDPKVGGSIPITYTFVYNLLN